MGYQALLDGYVSAQTEASAKGAHFKLDDGNEIHGGFEYTLPGTIAPRLRIGVWRDPDHGVRYEAPESPNIIDQRFAAYLPAYGAQTHFTFGGGVSIKRLELNVGADLSHRARLFSLTSVLRLG